jgi:hypothetical protein
MSAANRLAAFAKSCDPPVLAHPASMNPNAIPTMSVPHTKPFFFIENLPYAAFTAANFISKPHKRLNSNVTPYSDTGTST